MSEVNITPQTDGKPVETQEEAPTFDKEELTNSIVDKIKSIFKKEEKQDSPPINTDGQNAKEVTQEEIDAIVAEKVRAEVDKLAAKTKQKAREQLDAKEQELTAKEKEVNLKEQFLTLNVDQKFQEFIKHELDKSETNLVDYLKENPQFVSTKQPTKVSTNIKPTGLDDKGADYLRWRYGQNR